MPSARTLRAKKDYYLKNIEKIRSTQEEYYQKEGNAKAKLDYQKNREQKKQPRMPAQRLVIALLQRRKRLPQKLAPEKKKAASKASYSLEPEKKKAASKASYSLEPEKKAASIDKG